MPRKQGANARSRKFGVKGGRIGPPLPPRQKIQASRSRARPKRGAGAVGLFASGKARNSGLNAPLAVGGVIPRSWLRMGPGAQTNCDAGHCDSVRVVGGDISWMTLLAKSTYTIWAISYNNGPAAIAQSLGPKGISPRLAYLTGVYTQYAFRRLKLTFIPLVGPSTSVSDHSIQAASVVAVGLNTDSSSSVGNDGPTTFAQICQNDPSVAFSAWQGGSLEYNYDGTKTWFTSYNNNTSNPDLSNSEQLALLGAWSNDNSVVTNGMTTHLIHAEYVIDLYRPQEPNTYNSVNAAPPLRQFSDEKEDYVPVPPPIRRVADDSKDDYAPVPPNSPNPSRRTASLGPPPLRRG